MAKIDTAYSLEIDDVIDAMEANELWIEGTLQDKRAFKCIDENCNAKFCSPPLSGGDTFSGRRVIYLILCNSKNYRLSV